MSSDEALARQLHLEEVNRGEARPQTVAPNVPTAEPITVNAIPISSPTVAVSPRQQVCFVI